MCPPEYPHKDSLHRRRGLHSHGLGVPGGDVGRYGYACPDRGNIPDGYSRILCVYSFVAGTGNRNKSIHQGSMPGKSDRIQPGTIDTPRRLGSRSPASPCILIGQKNALPCDWLVLHRSRWIAAAAKLGFFLLMQGVGFKKNDRSVVDER